MSVPAQSSVHGASPDSEQLSDSMEDPQGSAEEAGRRHPDFTEQAHAGGASPVPCAQHQSEMCARLGPFLRWKEKVKAAEA